MAALSRAQLIALLYENLPEKGTRIKTGAAVTDIETQEKGVKVHLKDGSVEQGYILIGVDGVYSETRHIMQQQLAQTPPDTWPMTAYFQGIYGCFRSYDGFEPGTLYQSRGTGIVSQIIVGADRGHFAILRPISPIAEPERYSIEDRDRLATELANVMVAPGVRFQDVWGLTDKETAAMVNQEEGYCDKWYHNRVVLAGDAVHKSTSATGLGVNNGINSAAALANELYRTLRSEPDPSTRMIEDAFARYQEIQAPESSRLHTFGRRQIRGVTWETWGGWFFDRFVNPWIGVNKVAGIIGNLIKRGQILEYVPFNDRKVRVPWDHSPTP
jgi:2-polyprenyl-6-methoxyphenol hydroxylase-like FAD-dependent oxidoreductase